MAFTRQKKAHSHDDSTRVDAGSTILKLTNLILADLQVDNVRSKLRSQNDPLGVVRDSRSYSDPAVGVNTPRQGPHPVYYDPTVILHPSVRQ